MSNNSDIVMKEGPAYGSVVKRQYIRALKEGPAYGGVVKTQ